MPRAQRAWCRVLLTTLLAGLACDGPPSGRSSNGGEAVSDTSTGRAPPATAVTDSALVSAAERIIGFLRGEAEFERDLLSDTVTLQVAPEGGGEKRTIPGDSLADRGSWTVGGYSLRPPAAAGELTTRVGSHFNCMEAPLATRSEELARLPHVGATLRPRAAQSCLQTWNMTLVFAPATADPELVAVLYDQWEW